MTFPTYNLIILLTIFAEVLSAPVTEQFWHLPCGGPIELENWHLGNLNHEIRSGLTRIKIQQGIALESFSRGNFENLYARAKNHIPRRQYIPHWIPNEHDIRSIRELRGASVQMIANHLPQLHTDLQKFSVAMSEMLRDENERSEVESLTRTLAFLQSLLCEVETVIVNLPFLRVPERISRSIMIPLERDPEDNTKRLVRDWGILVKFKEHMEAWKKVFNSY